MDKLNLLKASENEEHISRHTDSKSLAVGSKAVERTTPVFMKNLLDRFDKKYQEIIDKDGNPGRKVFAVECDRNVGTNSVVPTANIKNENKVFTITRDIGTRFEQNVQAVLITKEDMPQTNIVHAVYGPYGPTGNAGIYTLIYGDEGKPFPRELDGSEPAAVVAANEENKKYWDSHVFLCTPEELEKNVEEMRSAGRPVDSLEARLKSFNLRKENPLSAPYRAKVSEGAINISNNFAKAKGRGIGE